MTAQAASVGTVAPVIETARLRLRPHRPDDVAARCAMTADLEVMRFVGGVAHSVEENWARTYRYAGQWALAGRGLFVVEELSSGRFVGEVGIADFHRGLGADFDGAGEGAWVLDRWAAGKGYAHEAVAAAIGWHESRFGPMRLVCIIAPDNVRSLALADRLGFVPFREGVYHDRPILLLERAAGTNGGYPGTDPGLGSPSPC